MDIVKKAGIVEQSADDIHVENVKRRGFSIFKGLLSPEKVKKIKAAMYDVYERQVAEVGGLDKLKSMSDVGIGRSLFAYDRIFLEEILMQPTLLEYLNKFLDNAFTLFSQVGVFSEPQKELYQTAWHREIQYQHYTTSRPLAMQTLFILDPFNAETGGTFFLPGSHLFEEFPSDDYARTNMIQPILEPGDAILSNPMVYHKAGLNTSPNNRLLITNTFVRPAFASHFNYTKMIDPINLTDKEREILGFRWNYSETMVEWRKNRIAKANI